MTFGTLPGAITHYLQHTELGVPIRQIAREKACHPSTIQRQVRRVESARDDALLDSAINDLKGVLRTTGTQEIEASEVKGKMNAQIRGKLPGDQDREAMRILRRLSEPQACLAFAADMEKAVVVRETSDGRTVKTAVTDREIAQQMALRDWLVCTTSGRVSRYKITSAGRGALRRHLAENPAIAHADDRQNAFAEQHREWDHKQIAEEGTGRTTRVRYNAAESPISLLARRKDKNGEPFLEPDLVEAAERLREDFELAHIGPRVGQNWEKFLTGGTRDSISADAPAMQGSEAARNRVAGALRELGNGLADIVLRVCCFIEGVETAEKRLGWSARSGKVVLKIALQRLHHYYAQQGRNSLIG